jgi:hypothetical protein
MKKGLILYVIEGKEEMQMDDWSYFAEPPTSLGVSSVCVAVSEDEIAYGWWRLLARGMRQISCMKASYNAACGKLEPYGTPLRLCG